MLKIVLAKEKFSLLPTTGVSFTGKTIIEVDLYYPQPGFHSLSEGKKLTKCIIHNWSFIHCRSLSLAEVTPEKYDVYLLPTTGVSLICMYFIIHSVFFYFIGSFLRLKSSLLFF